MGNDEGSQPNYLMGALVGGAIMGALSAFPICLNACCFIWGFVGGLVGSLLIGFFANPAFFDAEFMKGILYGGSPRLLAEQALANGSAIVWSFALTFGIMIVLKTTIGVRVDAETEYTGLDLALHSETAYHGGGLH